LQELCADSSRKEEEAETIPRKLQKRGDCRNVCRNRNSVQESSRERRLQEMCAGNSRRVGAGEGGKCVQETSRERRLQELCAGNNRKRGGGRNYIHETPKERRWQEMCAFNRKRSRLQELCAGNIRKRGGAETEVEVNVCRKPQKVGDCKKFVQETAKERRCQKRVHETSRESRLQEICAGICKKDEGLKNYVQVSRDRNCVQETAEKKRLQELCPGNCKTEEAIGNVCRDQEERGIKSYLGKRRAKDKRVNKKTSGPDPDLLDP
jgi:hypothetical protein